MYNFEYHNPTSVADAVALLAKADDGKLVAGGMTLLPTLKQRLAQPSDLIDLGKVTGLTGIRREGNAVVIGAMTTHGAVAASAEVKSAIPGLAQLAALIGDPQVRNRGTLGGSICNNDPAADYPGALLALGATVTTNQRTITADDFFTGMFETALEEGEIVQSVSFPIVEKSAYEKFRNPASRYAIVGAFVAKTAAGVRVGVTGAGPTAFRWKEAEAALSANFSPSAVEGLKAPAGNLNSDIHASAEYRAHLIGVMTKRAVAGAG
ncbi:carbon-monoxide dehydrogenase medium subunit [Stella humosa]|uniref:Carbon-monoxide dehydrogenase medium subunit n=1 Tax=Stella humosa TaxID=94 RepID=A0A3N1ME26_9PROT|nr:xanthine dehydrogenase family protein subunit M [Stella humosa]ROQ01000.1 carbon-monoxide dehydrogenase medium subunit [Stella humosa]BBK31368.1 carbon monoxide dehydrogenase [Stella humosa]